ncbi:MAG: hypothetical protein ABI391_05455 [Hyphomicrobiaceae bacterium]
MANIGARISLRVKTGVAIVIAGSALLGGCSDGVEINSKLLDSMGLSTAALSANRAEPKLAQRAPLVMPPSTQKLPEPGAAPPPPPDVATNGAWPKDKDQERVASAQDKGRQQTAYCRDGNWKERAIDNDFGGTQGPQGNCGTIFSWVGNMFGGSAPTPDPMHGGTQ